MLIVVVAVPDASSSIKISFEVPWPEIVPELVIVAVVASLV